jgi:nitroreductase
MRWIRMFKKVIGGLQTANFGLEELEELLLILGSALIAPDAVALHHDLDQQAFRFLQVEDGDHVHQIDSEMRIG